MVDQKTVGFPVCLAILAQTLAHGLALLAGVGEDQTLLSPRVLKNKPYARVRRPRGGVRGFLEREDIGRDCAALVGLRRGVVKMLHGQPPDLPAAVEFRNDRAPAAARGQKPSRLFGIADGGGEPYPSRRTAGQGAKPLDKAEGLQSAVRPKQRVDLVDDDETKIPEQRGDLHMLVDHQRFQRFGGDLQYTGGPAQQRAFSRLSHVAVPAPDGDVLFLAQLFQPSELVVDQSLERGNVQNPHSLRRVFVQQRKDREKGRLGLAGSGGCRQKHIFLRAENGVAGGVLHGAQILPAGTVDVLADKGSVAVKNVHIVNSA